MDIVPISDRVMIAAVDLRRAEKAHGSLRSNVQRVLGLVTGLIINLINIIEGS